MARVWTTRAPRETRVLRTHCGFSRTQARMWTDVPGDPMQEVPGMSTPPVPATTFSVDSEVGRLRKVIVHRPGLEQRRLTPENAEDLLFDDVIWVRKAKVEHAAFVQVLRERGVEVFDAEDLLLETLGVPEGKQWLLDQVLQERQVGQYLA